MKRFFFYLLLILIPLLSQCSPRSGEGGRSDTDESAGSPADSESGEGFSLFFPRKVERSNLPGSLDLEIPVGKKEEVRLGARYYLSNPDLPTILYFHGNAEVADDLAHLRDDFETAGANLFVVDYRGYGWSSGEPTLQNLLEDVDPVLDFFFSLIQERTRNQTVFLLGRSLGALPATRAALISKGRFSGLILESAPSDIKGLLQSQGVPVQDSGSLEKYDLAEKLKMVALPVLILHGTGDSLIPPEHARRNLQALSPERSRILWIEEGGHNDLPLFRDIYFGGIADFLKAYSRDTGK